jgi:hypothetical protein
MGIVRFALRWPYTVLALLILFLGISAFRSMAADIFPEIDIPVVTVIWQYTGLRTSEIAEDFGCCASGRDYIGAPPSRRSAMSSPRTFAANG